MTRLDNTFRSSCKLLNRTTKQGKQAGQTYQLRSNSRLISSSNSSVCLDLHFIQTGRLFGTRLHERSRRTKKLSRTLRVMDVARQSSMKEELQVKLLSGKDISGDLIEGRVKGCASFTSEALLSVGSKDDGLNNDAKSLQKVKESSDSNRLSEQLTTINGDIKIEAIVRADNRTQTKVRPVDKMLLDLESRSLTAISGKVTNENLTGNMHKLDTENGYVDQTVNPTQGESNSITNCKLDGCEGIDDSHNGSTGEWTLKARPNTLVFICKKNGAHSTLDLHSLEKQSSRTQEDGCVIKRAEVESDIFSPPLSNGDSVGLESNAGVIDVKVPCSDENPCEESNVNGRTELSAGCRNVCDGSNKAESNEQSVMGDAAVLETCKCESQSNKIDERTQRRPKRNARSLKLRNDDEYYIDIKPSKRKIKERDDSEKEGNKAKKPKIKKQKKPEKLKIKESSCVADKDLGAEKGSSEVHCDDASKQDNSGKYVNVECVLGMRQTKNGEPQILVQFTDGTSNWIGKSEMQSPISSLSEYFTFSSQDLAVLHRLPFCWFGEPLIEWAQRDLKVSDFGVIETEEKRKLACLSLEKREIELLEREECQFSSPKLLPVSEYERAGIENSVQEKVDNVERDVIVDVEMNGVIEGNIITHSEIDEIKQIQNEGYLLEHKEQEQKGFSISSLHEQSDRNIVDGKMSPFEESKARTNFKLNPNWYEKGEDIISSIGKSFGPPDLSYINKVGKVKNATRDTMKPLDLSFVDMKINSLDLSPVKGHFGPPDLSYIDAHGKLQESNQEPLSPFELSYIEKKQTTLDKDPEKKGGLPKVRLLASPKRFPNEETTRVHPIFVSRNGELEVYEQDYIEIVLKHKDKRSKRIRSETCDNLIQQLESRIVDDKCPYIVISGLEDYFASTMDMEKLLKFPAEAEKTRYDEKMANLRYLFQTLKNYPKPIAAIVNSPASGLAAAILSLVDIVYDQSLNETKKNGLNNHTPRLPVLAPKLMGLQHKNEALLMGEAPNQILEKPLKKVKKLFKAAHFSSDLSSTLDEMKLNEKLACDRPSPRKRGRPFSTSRSPNVSIDSCHGEGSTQMYVKTRTARLRFPDAHNDTIEESHDTKEELLDEIAKEKQLATKCKMELAEFWNEIADTAS